MIRTLIGKNLVIVIAMIGLIVLDTAHVAASDDVIKRRIELMREDILGNFKVIIKFAKSGEGSMADVEKAAKGVQAAAAKVPSLFIKGTGRPNVEDKKTRALATIWDDWATFEKVNNAMKAHAGGVAMAASRGDASGVKTSFGMIGKEGCGGCHKLFRGPKAE